MTTIDQQLAALMESIYAQARTEVHAEILGNLSRLNGGTTPAAMKAAKRVSAPRSIIAPRNKHAPGPKRAPEEIAKTADAVFAFVKSNPGSNAEAIKAGLKQELSILELPIKKLLASKTIKKRGQRRATRYYPV